jgi:mRNA interferase RelE/StbE
MTVQFTKRFLKDLAQIPSDTRIAVEEFVFEALPKATSLASSGKVEQMQGYQKYFKVRFGQYRLGMREENGTVICERILHRKEIYRFFP